MTWRNRMAAFRLKRAARAQASFRQSVSLTDLIVSAGDAGFKAGGQRSTLFSHPGFPCPWRWGQRVKLNLNAAFHCLLCHVYSTLWQVPPPLEIHRKVNG